MYDNLAFKSIEHGNVVKLLPLNKFLSVFLDICRELISIIFLKMITYLKIETHLTVQSILSGNINQQHLSSLYLVPSILISKLNKKIKYFASTQIQ